MNTFTIGRTSLACVLLALALLAFGEVQAQEGALASIQFPIAELGGCENKNACKAYCDEPGHMPACLDFAEKHNLMRADELERAKKFLAAGMTGPGGCTGRESCEAYCHNPEHIEACVDFAEQHGLMEEGELAEARRVRAAIRSGVKPPPCGSREACEEYCMSADHMPACIAFARAAGLMSAEEEHKAEQMLAAIRSGVKPPPCHGKQECSVYCAEEAHREECIEFARAAGFMSDAEAEMAKERRQMQPMGKEGEDPRGEPQREGGFPRGIPPEVQACLGADAEALQAGNARMTPELAQRMGECMQQHRQLPHPEGAVRPGPSGEMPRPPEGMHLPLERPGEMMPPEEMQRPSSEPATEPSTSPESLSGAVLLFLHTLGIAI